VNGYLEFIIAPVRPFRLDLTVWTLRRNPRNIIDRWDGQTYRRVLLLSGRPVEDAVIQVGTPEKARLRVIAESSFVQPERKAVAASLERLLGLRVDLAGFYRFALNDRRLKTLARPFLGMKPPRYETIFESIVTAIASQQVTRTVSILILNRLAERYGITAGPGDTAAHAFPGPGELAGASPADLRRLGFSTQKGRAITALRGELLL
jgi:DNA-3-methyladenine glycosylase II